MATIIFTNSNYCFDISFSCSVLHEIIIMKFFNALLIFTPAVFILCKKVCGPRRTGVEAVKYGVP